MPKGVEHPEEINRDTVDEHAKGSVMPKGVEHNTLILIHALGLRAKGSVMPKSVEHSFENQVIAIRRCERISDAERR